MWNYPFGIVMVMLYAWIFFHAKLYSDTLLQLFFFVIQIYGWVHWLRFREAGGEVRVERLDARQRLFWLAGAAAAIAGWGALMRAYTDAAYPWWDATEAGLSVAAQLLMSRRYVENWVLWIVVDIISIGLYVAKDLLPTAGLYLVFLLLSIWGLVRWLRAARAAA